MSEANNGIRLTNTIDSQRWACTLVYPPMRRFLAQRILSFFNQNQGMHGTWQFPLSLWEPLGKLGGSPKVDITTLAGSTTVPTTDWAPNTRVVRRGDLIRFGHEKVYQLQGSAVTDSSGKANLLIMPSLRQTVTSGEALIATGLTMRVSFVSNSFQLLPVGWNYWSCQFRIEERI